VNSGSLGTSFSRQGAVDEFEVCATLPCAAGEVDGDTRCGETHGEPGDADELPQLGVLAARERLVCACAFVIEAVARESAKDAEELLDEVEVEEEEEARAEVVDAPSSCASRARADSACPCLLLP
jgi:hypothetical protein